MSAAFLSEWKSLRHVQLFATPWTVQSMEFSRPEHWSEYPIPSPGDLPNQGTEPRSSPLQADSLSAEPQFLGVALNTSYPQSRIKVISISSTDLGNFRDMRGQNCYYSVDTGTQVIILPRPTKEGSSHCLLMKFEWSSQRGNKLKWPYAWNPLGKSVYFFFVASMFKCILAIDLLNNCTSTCHKYEVILSDRVPCTEVLREIVHSSILTPQLLSCL